MTEVERPVPVPDAHTSAFWRACRRRVLEVSGCGDCGHLFLPAAPCCPRCWSPRIIQSPVSGCGEVFTFVVYRRTYHPALPAPYVVALVQLDEGPRLLSNLVGCEPQEVSIGMPVKVCFEDIGDFTLPLFEPLSNLGADS